MANHGVMVFDFYDYTGYVPTESQRFAFYADCEFFDHGQLNIVVAFNFKANGPQEVINTSETTVRLYQGGTIPNLDGTEVGQLIFVETDDNTGIVFTTTIDNPGAVELFTVSTEGDGTDFNPNPGQWFVCVMGAVDT